MDERFKVSPLVGFGVLLFGAPAATVALSASAYGQFLGGPSAADSEAALAWTLELLGDTLSEDDRKAVIAGMQPEFTTATFEDFAISIIFLHGKLNSVTTVASVPIHLNGALLYDLPPLDALRVLERMNGAPGRYRLPPFPHKPGTSAYFDNIAVGTSDFHIFDGAVIRPMPTSDERFAERSVGLDAEPHAPEEERKYWTTLPLPAP